ncbi:MAG: DUF4843 domain-containing protein [Pseudobacter sp.]|uniref:DUF4843 domain-containing protein n=1 Tax=Pseudobacter sp. TaxID=2045420 RepID=UPI003F8020D5
MKYFQYTCIGLLCWMLAACTKKDLMSFQAGDKVYIYKDTRTTNNDSTIYSFAVKPDQLQYDTIRIPIRIMGEVKPVDRKVNYAVIADSSDAQTANYELLPAFIPANSFTGVLPVRVMRTAELKTKQYTLWIRIGNSGDLMPGVSNQISYLIRINDFLTKPVSWRDNYFGKYSNVKFSLLIRETGYTQFNGLGTSDLRFIAQSGKNAVMEWEAANGATMLDENGEPVVFP